MFKNLHLVVLTVVVFVITIASSFFAGVVFGIISQQEDQIDSDIDSPLEQ